MAIVVSKQDPRYETLKQGHNLRWPAHDTEAARQIVLCQDASDAAVALQQIVSAGLRLRPILMTSAAMIVGMIPMASGLGESGDQTAPLGRAVIGGLAASTVSALLIVPLVYGWVQQKKTFKTLSLLPEDEVPEGNNTKEN